MSDDARGKDERGNTVITRLGTITYLDMPADVILEGAIGRMDGVVIMGWDKEGELYFGSTYADGGAILWLMELAKKRLMEGT